MSNLSDFIKSGVEAAGIVSVADSSAIWVDVDENVGIGTASPSPILTVEKSSTRTGSGGAITDAILMVRNPDTTADNYSGIAFGYSGNNYGSVIKGVFRNHTTGQTDITFETNTGSAFGERMRIDSSGRVLVGDNTTRLINNHNAAVQIQGTAADDSSMTIGRWSNDTGGTKILLAKSRGGIGTPTTVVTGDKVGEVMFIAADGNDMTREVAAIQVFAEGTVAADQVPGAMAFKVANSAGSNVEAMRINSGGAVTKPLNPAFNVYPSGLQEDIAVNTQVAVTFDAEHFDIGGNFASNIFTAPVTGKYQLNVNIILTQMAADASDYWVRLTTSNKIYEYGWLDQIPDIVDYNFPFSVLADMDANDTARLYVYQVSGTQQTDIRPQSSFSGFLAG